jgi:hypothetical protein
VTKIARIYGRKREIYHNPFSCLKNKMNVYEEDKKNIEFILKIIKKGGSDHFEKA